MSTELVLGGSRLMIRRVGDALRVELVGRGPRDRAGLVADGEVIRCDSARAAIRAALAAAREPP